MRSFTIRLSDVSPTEDCLHLLQDFFTLLPVFPSVRIIKLSCLGQHKNCYGPVLSSTKTLLLFPCLWDGNAQALLLYLHIAVNGQF